MNEIIKPGKILVVSIPEEIRNICEQEIAFLITHIHKQGDCLRIYGSGWMELNTKLTGQYYFFNRVTLCSNTPAEQYWFIEVSRDTNGQREHFDSIFEVECSVI